VKLFPEYLEQIEKASAYIVGKKRDLREKEQEIDRNFFESKMSKFRDKMENIKLEVRASILRT